MLRTCKPAIDCFVVSLPPMVKSKVDWHKTYTPRDRVVARAVRTAHRAHGLNGLSTAHQNPLLPSPLPISPSPHPHVSRVRPLLAMLCTSCCMHAAHRCISWILRQNELQCSTTALTLSLPPSFCFSSPRLGPTPSKSTEQMQIMMQPRRAARTTNGLLLEQQSLERRSFISHSRSS